MKSKQKNPFALISALGLVAITAGGMYAYNNFFTSPSVLAEAKVSQEGGVTVKEFELVAKPAKLELKDGTDIEAWTFNGITPGSQIRVTEGERVRVKLQNKLPEPVSIHWHGIPVPNAMDGIPGVTQNAVRPGETFMYDFIANTPGTYWYHSHQKSAEQVDKGLYGSIIVEPKNQPIKYDRDYTLVLDEWIANDMQGMDHSNMSSTDMQGMNHGNGMSGMNHSNTSGSNMQGMDHGNMNSEAASEMDHDQMMKRMYNVFTVNGKAGESIEPIQIKPGERVKLRFINAGFQTHRIHLQGQSFRITHSDGQEIKDGPILTDRLLNIAPGERYDIEFTADAQGNWSIDNHNDSPAANDMVIPVQYAEDSQRVNKEVKQKEKLADIDITKYGNARPIDPNTKYDIQKKLVLDSKIVNKNGKPTLVYTINGKTFPNTDPIWVKKGQRVKLTLTNPGKYDHPIHLHGHFFQVLTKNGQPINGSPLMKDTLNVRPGESYEIAFIADNDGNWMLHCHDLHHASAGMVTEVKYEGFTPAFTPDPTVGNMPE